MSLIFVCLIYVENIFSHLSLTITSFVSFFLYGNCALLCFSNKNLSFLVYLARLKLHRAIVQPRNKSEILHTGNEGCIKHGKPKITNWKEHTLLHW